MGLHMKVLNYQKMLGAKEVLSLRKPTVEDGDKFSGDSD